MINIQQLPPQIDFGFGKTAQRVQSNTPVKIWLNTLYNTGAYTFSLITPYGSLNKASDYEYTLTIAQPGTYSISLAVTQKATGIRLMSNILTLTIY